MLDLTNVLILKDLNRSPCFSVHGSRAAESNAMWAIIVQSAQSALTGTCGSLGGDRRFSRKTDISRVASDQTATSPSPGHGKRLAASPKVLPSIASYCWAAVLAAQIAFRAANGSIQSFTRRKSAEAFAQASASCKQFLPHWRGQAQPTFICFHSPCIESARTAFRSS